MDVISTFTEVCTTCITECIRLVRDPEQFEVVIVKLESVLLATESLTAEGHDFLEFTELLEESVRLILSYLEPGNQCTDRLPGRPQIPIKMETVSSLLSMNFKARDIAKMLRVSKVTLYRRMKTSEMSVCCFIYLLN